MAKLVDNPNLAFRLARAIVSDIALYNQEKVRDGIRNDTLFDLLKDELTEGREHFYGRVSPELTDRRSPLRPGNRRRDGPAGRQDRKFHLVR